MHSARPLLHDPQQWSEGGRKINLATALGHDDQIPHCHLLGAGIGLPKYRCGVFSEMRAPGCIRDSYGVGRGHRRPFKDDLLNGRLVVGLGPDGPRRAEHSSCKESNGQKRKTEGVQFGCEGSNVGVNLGLSEHNVHICFKMVGTVNDERVAETGTLC